MSAAIEISGQKFGNLTVIERAGSTSYGQSTWRCKCVCGDEGIFPWSSLKRGLKSCGCLWRSTFKNERICARCKKRLPFSEFGSGNVTGLNTYCKSCIRSKSKIKYHSNPEMFRARVKSARAKLREEVLSVYGPQCTCCGEKEKMFLAIDHVNNDGAEHRRRMGGKGGDHFYKWLKANHFPPGYQTLCANCNWGKHVNGGICPHVQRS